MISFDSLLKTEHKMVFRTSYCGLMRNTAHCCSTRAELSLSTIPIPASESLHLITFCLNHSDLGCFMAVYFLSFVA